MASPCGGQGGDAAGRDPFQVHNAIVEHVGGGDGQPGRGLGEDDRHLDFRVSVLLRDEGERRWATVTTAVQFHNPWGVRAPARRR